jgi:hypothetical protein
MWGPTFPELVEALLAIEMIDRSTAFDDARVAGAIEATGRRKLIFATGMNPRGAAFTPLPAGRGASVGRRDQYGYGSLRSANPTR